MADFTQIIQEINEEIKQNGANEITGAKLNEVLRDMIAAVNAKKQDPLTIDATPTEDSTNPVQSGGVEEALGSLYRALSVAENCLFGGYVEPNDEPHYGDDHRYYYLAKTEGRYTHFNNYEVDNYIVMFSWIESTQSWRMLTLWPNDQTVSEWLQSKQDTISDLAAIRSGAAAGATAYQKPSGGIPASDLASGVIPNSVVNATSQQDGTVVLTKVNGDTITIDLNHVHPQYYSKEAEITQPSGGMLPDVTYKLGTLTGATTFSFAAAVSGNVNHYYFTFTSGSTAVVPTWPASITSWDGNCVDSNTGLPVIAASKTYEVSVIDGLAMIKEW